MTTITKERLLTIKQWRETYGPGSNVVLPAEEAEELARIALASLEAEPVAWLHSDNGLGIPAITRSKNIADSWLSMGWYVQPLYIAKPVLVVPDARPSLNNGIVGFDEGWNACRAAMLQGKSEQPQNAQQNIPENIPGGNYPVTPDGWISCSERMPVIGELNWRTSFPLLVTCEIGVIPAYYGFVRVNGNKHYGFMESLKYGDDSGNHPQTNEYDLISNVTHWMPLPEPPQEVK
ncbi:DUF551 domain-containing protein [Escherichia coli]|uniref:DUF551 domain-containing protein n=1 Tax=Escherichia coli TaxID=562 RepID=UPI003D047116